MTSFLVVTTRSWNLREYELFVSKVAGDWHLVDSPADLTLSRIRQINPRYVFFPHWSWKVPAEIFKNAECILFHMTDLPFGRGGSPLQNLIARGESHTKVSAVRMTGEIDAGPVYLKRPLSLDGSAQQIFERLSGIVFDMIAEIVETGPTPVPQKGEPTFFKRRTPSQSALPGAATAEQLYDHIRMLDAETYPRAFLDVGDWRIEFSDAELSGGSVNARASIRPRAKTES